MSFIQCVMYFENNGFSCVLLLVTLNLDMHRKLQVYIYVISVYDLEL